MTEEEIDSLAREILSEAVKEVKSWQADYFYSIDQVSEGDLIVTFAGTSPEGYGSVACELMPLGTVKTLIRRCEITYDESIPAFKKTVGESVTITLPQLLAESRENTVRHMAWHVTLNLIAFFRTRLSNTIEDAIEDCTFIAETLLGGAIAYRLNQLVPGVAIADMRSELEIRETRAATKKKAWLRSHTEGLPHVLTGRSRGAPVKSEFVRQRERQKFLADIEAAYRKLREKNHALPTKTSVARELGIGGDPKRGGQSSLQVFNAKLKRYEIDYKSLAARVESELNNNSK